MLYSCKPLFEKIKAQVGAEIDNFPIEDPPRVCIITTGEDEPSARYVRNKLRDFTSDLFSGMRIQPMMESLCSAQFW